jgi:deazaflavin-dependent oxidoreductase (nitroreductase family)
LTNSLQFLHLNTTGWKSGKQHQIEIWFVEYDGKYFILSERRRYAHWVQNIIHNPIVSFTVNHTTFTGTARMVDQHKEPELTARVSKLMSIKYGWNEGLIVELSTA